MLKLIYVIIFLFLTACATNLSTSYQNQDGRYGLKVKEVKDSYFSSIFQGNSHTKHKKAYAFSKLGAVDHCQRKGLLALLYKTYDASTKTSYTQVSSSNYTIPGFSKYKGKTYRNSSNDKTYSNVYSYPVTKRYPKYYTLFRCIKTYAGIEGAPSFEILSKELVSPITKDFKGGLLVKEIEEGTALKEGDVIINSNNKRVENFNDIFDETFNNKFTKSNSKLKLTVIRKQKFINITVSLKSLSESLFINNYANAKIGCEYLNVDEKDVYVCQNLKKLGIGNKKEK